MGPSHHRHVQASSVLRVPRSLENGVGFNESHHGRIVRHPAIKNDSGAGRDQRRRRKRRNPYAARDERANAQPNTGRTNQNRQAIPKRPRIHEVVKSSHVSLSSACCSRNGSSGMGSTAKITRNGIAILNSATLARKAGARISRVSSCVSATKHAPASDALNVSIGPVFTRARG